MDEYLPMPRFPLPPVQTGTPESGTLRFPIDVWIVVFPNFLLLDATGPIQVFSTANDEATDAGLTAPYRIRLAAPGGGSVTSSAGVSVLTQALPQRELCGATMIVAGGRVKDLPSRDTAAGRLSLQWVERASGTVARCCGVCTGAFVLARAGLLEGRRAVTHWQDLAELRSRHPSLMVVDDAIHVKDDKFYTSAGISAGMDLALSLVEEDLGRQAALAVAKRLVLFLKRPGGQRQFSSELPSPSHEGGVYARLTAWLRPRLKRQVRIEDMAAACALSVRTLHRKLRLEADITPAQLLARLRMENACLMLERPGMTVKQAARECGYTTEYNLRRAFTTQLGVLPSEYQSRFA
ncbi:GlxA family transcriptional regulator [Massilia niabensis]|uniref:GlxA family transcriptional regulator n=1 Tax=Massilia niabensis TaxID=544910 RepID=A0ABW0LBH3_9BURK